MLPEVRQLVVGAWVSGGFGGAPVTVISGMLGCRNRADPWVTPCRMPALPPECEGWRLDLKKSTLAVGSSHGPRVCSLLPQGILAVPAQGILAVPAQGGQADPTA